MNRFFKTSFGGLAIAAAFIIVMAIFGGIVWVLNIIGVLVLNDPIILHAILAIIVIISLIISYFCNKPAKDDSAEKVEPKTVAYNCSKN